MGYAKKRNYRRRKPVSWYNKKYSTKDLAVKAFAGMKTIKKLINVERKYTDSISNAAASSTPVVFDIANLAVGDGPSERNGNSIKPQRLLLRYKLNADSTAGNVSHRFMVVRDTQQIADTDPSVTDVLESASVTSFRSETNKGRFQLLHDMVWCTGNLGNIQNKFVEASIPMTGHIRYNGSAGTDIQKNGLYMMYFSDQVTKTTSVDLKTRLYFTDN